MPTISKSKLFELLIFALIAQAFVSALPPAQIWRRLSRRAIDGAAENPKAAANGHDIAAVVAAAANVQSDDQIRLKLKSFEGNVVASANTADSGGESEITRAVKSTNLLPALGNYRANAGESKSSATLMLNRVESHEAESASGYDAKKFVEETAENSERERERESRDDRSTVNYDAEEVTSKQMDAEKSSVEQQNASTTRGGSVFNPAHETPLPQESSKAHVHNGFDEMALQLHDGRPKSVASLTVRDEPPATDESILKDVENVALKIVMPTTVRALPNDERTEAFRSTVAIEAERRQNGNSLQEVSESSGRSMDAVQSSENKLESAFGEKLLAEEVLAKKTNTTTVATPILAALGYKDSENREFLTTVAAKGGANELHLDQNETNIAEQQDNKQIAAVDAEPETTTKELAHLQAEIDKSSTVSNTSAAEKRGKFISDNSTNSRKMNLPDGPEVWSLAGMRMVSKVTHNNGTSTLTNDGSGNAYPRWQLNEIVTTERTLNVSSYSEKNLLDWTKVTRMRSELEPADTKATNHITEGALADDSGIKAVKESKTELPSLMAEEKWVTEGASKFSDESTTHPTTEAIALLNNGENPSVLQVMNENDIMQTLETTTTTTTTTAIPTIVTTTQIPFSSDSTLSIDNNGKHADVINIAVAAGVGDSLNKSSSAYTDSSTLQQSADKTNVGNFRAAGENSTQRQPSDDFNFIVTSTTPVAALEVAGAATAMSIPNETMPTTTTTTTAATMPTVFPLEQSTSTTPSPNGAAAPMLWENATAPETQSETTQATLPHNVDVGVNNTTVVVSSSSDGVHDVTLEQHSKREPETVTETETETEAQTTLLTVSEQPSSEAHVLTSAGERESNLTVNASASASPSVETGVGISTQNETPNFAAGTTTESSHIATTTPIAFTNTTAVSTDLVEINVNAQTSAEPTVTVTESATTTEVGQIGNEVELEVHTAHITAATVEQPDTATDSLHSDTGSRAGDVLEEKATTSAETSTTAKTVSSITELLMPTTSTTTSTTAVPITTPPTQLAVEPVLYAATTLKSDESANEGTSTTIIPLEAITVWPTGSVLDNSTGTAAPTPVDFQNHTAGAEGAHDAESSIETNVIDQLDNTTVKISDTSATKTTTTAAVELAEADAAVRGAADAKAVTVSGVSNETVLDVAQDVDRTIAATTATTTTTTTMASITLSADSTPAPLAPEVNNSSLGTATTEPPLINLLDDSTTSRTTTTISITNQPFTTTSSIGVKPQEVYTVFSTTEGPTTTASTSTAAIDPLVPMIDTTTGVTSSPVNSTTAAYIPTVVKTIATATTTMLPPTLHAAIGGGGGGGIVPTHLPDMINAGMHPNSSDTNETDVNVIIAITVSVIGVVALILLVAFLYLMRKRQKQMSYGQRCRPVSLDAYSLDNVSVLGSVRRKGALRASKRSYGNIAFDDPSLRHNALGASELAKFVERRSSIFEEFRDVPQIITRADEVPPGCEDKNRYANVIPLPETRVVLQQLGDDDKTEYINANYVRGPKDAPNYYIATQAPLETTVADFWRMIWEQQSRVIVQATDLYENGIEKCTEYLPPSVTMDNHTTYGDFQITLKHREVKDKYAISTLMLKNTAENMSREITHYWYKWPETGVPSEEAPIIAMLLEARSSLKGYVNEAREKSSSATLKTDADGEVTANGNGVTVISMEDVAQKTEIERTARNNGGSAEINGNVSATTDKAKNTTLRNQGPLTIHCSPGTGRTGTIIACDMAIRSLETPKRSVDIPQIVYYVRRGRASAVQTKEQYEFIYKVAHMYATKITNLSNDN